MADPKPALEAVRESLAAIAYLADPAFHREREERLATARGLLACRFAPLPLPRPPLVAIVGGTNVGKSTLFNLLLGQPLAQPCATAAGTRAIVLSVPEAWRRVWETPALLPSARLLPYEGPEPLNQAAAGPPRVYLHHRPDGPAVALADTPDIDSTERDNHRATRELLYLADAVLFVTTEQKYADEACDTVLARAGRCGQAVLVVLNRSDGAAAALADLREVKLPRAGFSPPPEVICLPLLADPATAPPALAPVRAWLDDLARRTDEVLATAQRGAVRGLVEAAGAALDDLEREVAVVRAFERGAARAIAERIAEYRPPTRLDELDQAVLEALAELRLPWLDDFYDALGLRLRSLGRAVRSWLMSGLGRPQPTVEEIIDEELAAEGRQAASLLESLLAALRDEVRQTGDLLPALLERLPDPPADSRRQAVAEYLDRLAAERRAIVDEAKAQVLAQLRDNEQALKLAKGTVRVAAVGASLAITLHTGGVAAQDVLIAPVVDVAFKQLAEHFLGRTWRETMAREVAARRRTLLAEWLEAAALEPFRRRLPAAHRDDFLERARAAVAGLAE